MISQAKTDQLNIQLINEEWTRPEDGSTYLNTGSCGRKPKSVIQALKQGIEDFNINPTLSTFLDTNPWESAHIAASRLFAVEDKSLIITNGATQGMQLVMQSFLLSKTDELVTTNHEHGSTRAIMRWLQDNRGITVKQLEVEPLKGSRAFCDGILGLITKNTRLVQISEIDCATGWRPDIAILADELNRQNIPLLVDGAHSPGHGTVRPSQYPLWVGSGHKWLCGPNGTGFIYAAPDLIPQLKPLWLTDKTYNLPENDLSRFEYQGTTDVSRLTGLAAAIELYEAIGPESALQRQKDLISYLRNLLSENFKGALSPDIRTPDVQDESTGMLTFTWPSKVVPVADLRETLWNNHQIWIQPDFYHGEPGHGMRISCHASTSKADLDKLASALASILQV